MTRTPDKLLKASYLAVGLGLLTAVMSMTAAASLTCNAGLSAMRRTQGS